ncbi:hypothetical protein GBA52_027176, partial [Prunus armeniaca]
IRVNGTKNERLDQHKLPPGSTGWPIIGETLEYLRTGKKGVPEKFIADRRNKYKNSSSSSSANCKVFKTSLLFEDMAVLCTAAGNKFLFSNEKKLIKSWWPPHLDKLIFADSAPDEKAKAFITEESTRFRNTMAPYLKPAGIQKYVGTMDTFTKKHLDMYWEDGKDDDQVIKAHPLAKRYAVTMACRLMLDTEDQQVFNKLENLTKDLSSGFTSLPIDLPGTQFNRAIRGSRQLREEIKNIVTQRRIHLSTRKVDDDVDGLDILSSLIMDTSTDGQGLSDSEIASKLYGVIVSGYDTFSSTLAAIVMCLAELPHVYDALKWSVHSTHKTQSTSQIQKSLIRRGLRDKDHLLTHHLFLLEEDLGCVQAKNILDSKCWCSCTTLSPDTDGRRFFLTRNSCGTQRLFLPKDFQFGFSLTINHSPTNS